MFSAIVESKTECRPSQLMTSASSEPLTSQLSTSSQYTSVSAATAVTTPSTTLVNNGNIPVGIAFARQRFISNTNNRTPIHDVNKATVDVLSNSSVVVSASSASCSYASSSSSSSSSKTASSFSPVLPYHHMLVEPAGLTSSISNIGFVAGAVCCEDKLATNITGNLPPSIITWSTHTSNLPTQQQPLTQQWHPYNGSVETQIQNMSSACTNYQLIREPVSSHIMLIPTNGIGVMMPYDFTRTPSITAATNVTVPVAPQIISNNSGFSLVQQFNSSNVHNASVNVPQHFSTNLSTSGSFLIQQICAADSRSTTAPLNHVNVVAESVATTAAAQPIPAISNNQSSYARSNTSFVYNAEPMHSDSTTMMQQVQSSGSCLLPPSSYQSSFRHVPSAANVNVHPTTPVAMQICNTATSATKHSETEVKCTSSFSSSTVEICPVSEENREREVGGRSGEETTLAIKLESTNSSVQDASNQTDSTISYRDETESNAAMDDAGDTITNGRDSSVLDAETDGGMISQCNTSKGENAAADKTSATSDGSPDFSGLQLLLNGIERTEHDWKVTDRGKDVVAVQAAPKTEEATPTALPESDADADKPNGLLILCALADQRFFEEEKGVDSEATASSFSSRSSLSSSCSSSCADEPKKRKLSKKNGSPPRSHKSGMVLAHRYKSIRSDQRTCHRRRYSRQRRRICSPDEGPIQIRLELAKLQKKYRETRQKLSQLARLKYAQSSSTARSTSPSSPTPPPAPAAPPPVPQTAASVLAAESEPTKSTMLIKRRPGRPRKSHDVAREDAHGRCTPASRAKLIDLGEQPKKLSWSAVKLEDDEAKVPKFNNGDLSPPVLEPMYTSPNVKSLKNDILGPPPLIVVSDATNKKSVSGRKRLLDDESGRSAKRKNKPSIRRHTNPDYSTDEEAAAISINELPKLEPGTLPTLNISTTKLHDDDDATPPPLPTPIPKRKVGRPRKFAKETISAAPPIKDDLVRKRKQIVPVPVAAATAAAACSMDGISMLAINKRRSKEEGVANTFGKRNEKLVPIASSNVSITSSKSPRKVSSDDTRSTYADYKPKITPKLKAEAKLKTWRQRSQDAFEDALQLPCPLHPKQSGYCGCSPATVQDGPSLPPSVAAFERWHSRYEDNELLGDDVGNTVRVPTLSSSKRHNENEKDFRITPSLLEMAEKRSLRVLIAVGGLFRAGQLSAVRAPDLYGIKLDGERGQRTHIYTKEEILKDVVLEVRGKHPLKKGTRVCAFWSSQYLSLYPGYVTSFSSSDDDSADENYTAVEFDDGDSGRIRYSDIRLLPQDFALRRHSTEELADFSENETVHERKLSDTYFEEMAVRQRHRHRHRSHPVEGCENTETKYFQPRAAFSSASTSSSSSSSSSSCNSLSVLPFAHKTVGTTNERPQHRDQTEENEQRKRMKKKRKREFREKFGSHERYGADAFVDANGNVEKREKRKHKHREHRKKKKKRTCRSKEREHDTEPYQTVDSCERDVVVPQKNIEDDKIVHMQHDLDLTEETEQRCDTTVHSEEGMPRNSRRKSFVSTESPFCLDGQRDRATSVDSLGLPEPTSKLDDSIDDSVETSMNDSDDRVAEDNENGVIQDESSSNCDQKNDTNTKVETVTISNNETTLSLDEDNNEEETAKCANDDKERESQTVKEQTQETQPSSTTTDVEEEVDDADEEASATSTNSNDMYWRWHGKGLKRNGKGRARKEFYKSIKRGDVLINVGDCAVFLTANSWAKPFIGRVESMWESYGNMSVRVNWFYHPEETVGLRRELPFLGGALFESPHSDKNDVQTISHKCEVVSLEEYRERVAKEAQPEASNRLYYLAGYYDPTAKRLSFEQGIFS